MDTIVLKLSASWLLHISGSDFLPCGHSALGPGKQPRDWDSHIIGPLSLEGTEYDVSDGSRSISNENIALDGSFP